MNKRIKSAAVPEKCFGAIRKELDYFNDLTILGVNRCETQSNRGLRVNKNYTIGIMLRGPAILYTADGSRRVFKAPFLYWSSCKRSWQKRGTAWRTPPGVIRENLWMDLAGARAERMIDSLDRATGGSPNYIYLEKPEKLCEVFERLRQCFVRDLPSEKFLLPLLLEEFMASVGEVFASPNAGSRLEKTMEDIMQEMAIDPGKEFDIRKIAASSGVSEAYFRHCFQQYAGKSFYQYLLLQKYNYAVKLLRSRSLSVNEIAEKCNFGTSRQFSSFFRKYAGVSPLQFRKKMF